MKRVVFTRGASGFGALLGVCVCLWLFLFLIPHTGVGTMMILGFNEEFTAGFLIFLLLYWGLGVSYSLLSVSDLSFTCCSEKGPAVCVPLFVSYHVSELYPSIASVLWTVTGGANMNTYEKQNTMCWLLCFKRKQLSMCVAN